MISAGERPDAPLARRFFAGLIDFVLVPMFSILLMLVTGMIEHAEAWVDGFPWLRVFSLGVMGYLLLNGLLLYRHGQTLGKRLTRLKVVDVQTNETPAFWRLILLRAPFFPILHFGLWYLALADVLFVCRKDRRCAHDYVCRTRVISLESK